jgi:hypothetical protein
VAGTTASTAAIASGGFQNSFGGGTADAFVVKFDLAGNRTWATYYGGPAGDVGKSITVDQSENVYLSGYTFSNSAISAGGFQNALGGSADGFVAAFSGNGNRLCATYYGGAGIEDGPDVTVGTTGNVYLAGNTDTTAGIASGGFQNTYGGGIADAFLVKFTACALKNTTAEHDAQRPLAIFPNPSAGKFIIEGEGDVRIYNVLGEIVLTQSIQPGKTEIDLHDRQKGVYFIELRSGEKRAVQKLVLQ